MRAVLILLVLLGCGPPQGARPVTAAEADLLEAVEQEWVSRGLASIGEDCEEQARGLRVLVTSDVDVFTQLVFVGPEQALSAVRSYRVRMFDADPLVVIWHLADSRRGLAHEYTHVLEACTGHGVDRWHLDERVWGPRQLSQEALR